MVFPEKCALELVGFFDVAETTPSLPLFSEEVTIGLAELLAFFVAFVETRLTPWHDLEAKLVAYIVSWQNNGFYIENHLKRLQS